MTSSAVCLVYLALFTSLESTHVPYHMRYTHIARALPPKPVIIYGVNEFGYVPGRNHYLFTDDYHFAWSSSISPGHFNRRNAELAGGWIEIDRVIDINGLVRAPTDDEKTGSLEYEKLFDKKSKLVEELARFFHTAKRASAEFESNLPAEYKTLVTGFLGQKEPPAIEQQQSKKDTKEIVQQSPEKEPKVAVEQPPTEELKVVAEQPSTEEPKVAVEQPSTKEDVHVPVVATEKVVTLQKKRPKVSADEDDNAETQKKIRISTDV